MSDLVSEKRAWVRRVLNLSWPFDSKPETEVETPDPRTAELSNALMRAHEAAVTLGVLNHKRDALLKAGTQYIHAKDYIEARETIAILRQATETEISKLELMSRVKAPAAGSGTGFKPPVTADKLSSAGQAWMMARNKVQTEIKQLRAAFLGTFAGTPHEGDLARRFDHRVQVLLEMLDSELGTVLHEMSKAQDEAGYNALATRTRVLVKRYEFVAVNDPAIPLLDANPFKPCAVGRTLSKSFDEVRATIG